MEKFISALAFNVSLDKANEILLKPAIEKALLGQGKLSEIYKHKSFFHVFDNVFYDSNIKLDIAHITTCLNELPPDLQSKNNMQKYWKKLTGNILHAEKFELKYTETIKIIIKRMTDESEVKNILEYLFKNAISKNDQNKKFYSGSKYFELISEFDALLKEIWKEKTIADLLSDNDIEPEEYFDFIISCPESYQDY